MFYAFLLFCQLILDVADQHLNLDHQELNETNENEYGMAAAAKRGFEMLGEHGILIRCDVIEVGWVLH